MKTCTVGQWRRTRWNYDKCSDSNLHILVPLYLEPCVCGCVCICMCVCENESEREIWNLHHIYHHLHHHTTAPEWLVLGNVFTHIPPPPPPPPPTLPNPPHSHSQATSRGAMGRSAWRREIEEQKEKWDETSHTSRKGNGVGGQCEDGGGDVRT